MDHEASPAENQQRRCPKCTAFSRFAHSILDSQRGITFRLYKCIACGEHLWDDDYNSFSKISASGRAAGQTPAKPANDRSEGYEIVGSNSSSRRGICPDDPRAGCKRSSSQKRVNYQKEVGS
jgi:hypothetical protein